MGSPSNVDMIMGYAKVPVRAISTAEWCNILETALGRIRPCLKYISRFKTVGQLLNSRDEELLLGRARFITKDDAMPNLDGTDLTPKTRFIALQVLDSVKNLGRVKTAATETAHEIKHSILLMTDTGRLVILHLSFFRREYKCLVCSSSLVANSMAAGHKSVLEVDGPEIRGYIDHESISTYNLLDHLYLLLYRDIDAAEKRLNSKRAARDMLKQMCDRIAV
jgi:hypothetical protein